MERVDESVEIMWNGTSMLIHVSEFEACNSMVDYDPLAEGDDRQRRSNNISDGPYYSEEAGVSENAMSQIIIKDVVNDGVSLENGECIYESPSDEPRPGNVIEGSSAFCGEVALFDGFIKIVEFGPSDINLEYPDESFKDVSDNGLLVGPLLEQSTMGIAGSEMCGQEMESSRALEGVEFMGLRVHKNSDCLVEVSSTTGKSKPRKLATGKSRNVSSVPRFVPVVLDIQKKKGIKRLEIEVKF